MTSNKDWVSVGALAEGFAPESYVLEHSGDLANRTMTLRFQDGAVTELAFAENRLTWRMGTAQGDADYRATQLRRGIYFVDFLAQHGDAVDSISLVVDTLTDSVTAVEGRLPTHEQTRRPLLERAMSGEELTSVAAKFRHGRLGDAAGECAHSVTNELIGRRTFYRYSATEHYEHIYLNDQFYTWHCLKGVEAGLADTDRCHYFKIDEQLYLFVWREKIVPTLGVVLIDFNAHRSDGKICGYQDQQCTTLTNFPVASHCRPVGRVEDEAYA